MSGEVLVWVDFYIASSPLASTMETSRRRLWVGPVMLPKHLSAPPPHQL